LFYREFVYVSGSLFHRITKFVNFLKSGCKSVLFEWLVFATEHFSYHSQTKVKQPNNNPHRSLG
jgi:hypothetical protein